VAGSGAVTAASYNGVTVANGGSGALTVTGTASVSGANTGDQSTFGTIAVSGQSNVVADAANDTLTLVAGSGISITTNASTDTVTIAATGGGGSGAPTGASYVVLGTDVDLTAERVLTAGTGITLTDGGAGSTLTVAVTAGTYQPADSTLTALAAFNTNGLLTQTAADTFTGRTLTGTSNRISVTNGDGVSGNPTVDISSSYAGQATITTLGTVTTGTWTGQNVTAKAASGTSSLGVSSPDGTRAVTMSAANTGSPSLAVTNASGTGYLQLYATANSDLGLSNSVSAPAYLFELTSQDVSSSAPVLYVGRLSALTVDGDSTGVVYNTPVGASQRFAVSGTEVGRFDSNGLRLGNTGLRIRDTDNSHVLTIQPTSNLTANRVLSVATGDAARTVTLSGDLTVSATATVSGTNTGDQTSVTGNAGTATALATARAIYGNNFDGTAALTQVIASTYGGTGNGFTKFSGPTTSEKTFTLPNASATVLTDAAAVTVAQGGTGGATAAAARSGIGFVTLTTTATTGTVTLDCAADNPTFVLSLTGNVTLALSNEADGRRFTLFVRGQASGYTITWWASIKWSGGAAPTIPTVSGRVLPISFIRLASGEWLGIPGTECY